MLLRLRLLAGRIYRTLPIVREMYAMHSVVKQQTDCIRAIANIAMREMSDSYHVRSADPLRLCRLEWPVDRCVARGWCFNRSATRNEKSPLCAGFRDR